MAITAIAEDRPLTADEATLIRWMLEHGAAAALPFLGQLADVRVVSRCGCGCPSIDFSVRGVVPSRVDGVGILADFEYRTAEGHFCGVFVFARAGLLAGLEVWSMDGLSIRTALPAIEQLSALRGEWQP